MDAIITWILENWPVLGIIVIVSIIAWFVSRYFKKLEDSRRKVESLPCHEHKDSIDGLNSMRLTVDSINDQVTEISKWIMRIDDSMINPLAKKCSPRMMTKMGLTLFQVSGAEKTLQENSAFLINEIEEQAPATPYDVEDAALNTLLKNISHPMFNNIKNYIYYQPEFIILKDENNEEHEVRVSLNAIVRLMSIRLRDLYLVKHPEVIPE